MKVYLLKNVERVGIAGEIIKVNDGYANNYLIPHKLAVEITKQNEATFASRQKQIENRKEVVATQTSMLAEKISSISVTIKRKVHDDGKLYGSISAGEIVDALAAKGVSISKNQVELPKGVKSQGTYEVIIHLSSRLQPKIQLKVVAE